jgi:hypothetical protein
MLLLFTINKNKNIWGHNPLQKLWRQIASGDMKKMSATAFQHEEKEMEWYNSGTYINALAAFLHVGIISVHLVQNIKSVQEFSALQKGKGEIKFCQLHMNCPCPEHQKTVHEFSAQ